MPAGDYSNCQKCGKSIFGATFLCHSCALKMQSYGTSYDADGQIKNITDNIEDGSKILKDMSREETLDDYYYEMIDNFENGNEECDYDLEDCNRKDETLEEVFDNFFNKSPAPAPRKIVSKEFDELFEDMAEKKETAKSLKRKTLVVNLFAGPGAGKSTLAAGIFYELKSRGINCELATEFVKDLVWEERHKAINNQIYIFAKQHHRITRLLGEVDVIITDSPLLNTLIYGKFEDVILDQLAKYEHCKLWTFNCFIKRAKGYNPKGRNHTSNEARALDINIANMLDDENIPYEVYFGNAEGKDKIVNKILQIIRKK